MLNHITKVEALQFDELILLYQLQLMVIWGWQRWREGLSYICAINQNI